MASTSTTPANLPCGQCGFINEAERVYCHNCGSKLDRSLLPKEEERKQESPEQARKRITKITNPKSGSSLREIKTLLKVAVYAALAAAVILMVQQPDAVPEAKREAMQRMVSSDMMEALQSPQPRALSFTEEEVNLYLKTKVKREETLVPGVDAVRTYARFYAGALRIGSEKSFWGYPIYTEILFHPEIKDGKFAAKVAGGNLGRLAVDPRLMEYGDFLFQGAWDALKRERAQMDKMQKIEVKKGEILLVTKGAAQ